MINRKIELLAPSGDFESVYAAVNNGADAIYIGGSRFSARAFAKNFSLEDIREVVEYCHSYGVKVYITINTLIKQKEMAEALDYINELSCINIDAVIIQDIGLAKAIFSNFNDLEVHASTQMSTHNKETSLFLKDMGFSRIVLARELPIEEIEDISKVVETEVFVHGALCVCYSGQCLMSSMIGGRSGNRGRCAQPCRLPYDIINKKTGESNQGYLLSPKDICTIENINDLIQSGITSFKIEGRMKRPEYVAGVVESYRKVIDSSLMERPLPDVKGEKEKLLQLFNREGFSKGYLLGNKGRDMMSYNYPKNTGVLLGKAFDNNLIELTTEVWVNDGIRVNEEGAVLTKIIKEGKEVSNAFEGDKVRLFPTIYKSGDVLYKTTDHRLNEELKQSFKNKYGRKIPVDIQVEFLTGKALKLRAYCGEKEYCYEGAVVEKALNKPLLKEFIIEKLKKAGNTPFSVEKVTFNSFDDGFMSAASLNEGRRNLLSQINTANNQRNWRNTEFTQYNFNKTINNKRDKSRAKEVPNNLFVVSTEEQLKALQDLGVNSVVVDVYSRHLNRKKIFSYDIANIFLKLPNIARTEYDAIIRFVEGNINNIKGIVTANLALIDYFKDKTLCIGDYKLNIFNSEGLHFINDYCDVASLSVELNRSEIKDTLKALPKAYPVQIVAYGKTELMVSEYCPIGSVMGDRNGEKKCEVSCHEGAYVLKDRKGMEFVIRNDYYCRSHIYNSVPINLIPYIKDLRDMGVSYFRYDFIDESYEEAYGVVEAILNNKGNLELAEYTRGHYKRGVE